jgi:hypothetical protein
MDQEQYTTFVEVLKQIPDPRKRQGRRHPLVNAVMSDCGSTRQRTTYSACNCALGSRAS